MRHIYSIIILTILTFSNINGQTTIPKQGTYGAYLDISTFTELTLNNDHTFIYYDQFELGGTFKHSGKWKMEGQKLILCGSENNVIRPMPSKWKIKGNELVSKKVKHERTGNRIRIVLTFSEKNK